MREIQRNGGTQSADPFGIREVSGRIADILFFDSHYELERANLRSGLVAIRKCGGAGVAG